MGSVGFVSQKGDLRGWPWHQELAVSPFQDGPCWQL